MKFKAEDGTIVTDELIEKMAEPWDSGEVPGIGGEIVRGRPRMSTEPLVVLSFKVPKSRAEQITRAAKVNGETRSGFLREAAYEKAAQALANA